MRFLLHPLITLLYLTTVISALSIPPPGIRARVIENDKSSISSSRPASAQAPPKRKLHLEGKELIKAAVDTARHFLRTKLTETELDTIANQIKTELMFNDLKDDIIISSVILLQRLNNVVSVVKADPALDAVTSVQGTLYACISLTNRLDENSAINWADETGFERKDMKRWEERVVTDLKGNILVTEQEYSALAKHIGSRTVRAVAPTKQDQDRVVRQVRQARTASQKLPPDTASFNNPSDENAIPPPPPNSRTSLDDPNDETSSSPSSPPSPDPNSPDSNSLIPAAIHQAATLLKTTLTPPELQALTTEFSTAIEAENSPDNAITYTLGLIKKYAQKQKSPSPVDDLRGILLGCFMIAHYRFTSTPVTSAQIGNLPLEKALEWKRIVTLALAQHVRVSSTELRDMEKTLGGGGQAQGNTSSEVQETAPAPTFAIQRKPVPPPRSSRRLGPVVEKK